MAETNTKSNHHDDVNGVECVWDEQGRQNQLDTILYGMAERDLVGMK